jgi:type I restriction enzyme, S subunit
VKWPTVKLGEVTEVRIGPFGSLLHKEDYVADGVPLVNPMHIEDGSILPDPRHTVAAEKASQLANYRLKEGDVILGRRGEMGRCAVVDTTSNGYLCGTGSLIVRPGPSLYSKFLTHLLSSPDMVRTLERESLGTTMPNLNQEIVANIQLPLPPLDEQRRIAAILDRADTLRAKRRKMLEHIDLLPDTCLFEQSAGAMYSSVALGSVADVKGGKRLPKGAPYSETSTAHPYIRVSDLESGQINTKRLKYIDDEVHGQIARYVVGPNDVVISIAGSIGHTATVPAALTGANLTENAARITPKHDGIYRPGWLAAALRTPQLQSQIRSYVGRVTIGKLALFRIENLVLDLPSLESQDLYLNRTDKVGSLRAAAERGSFDELFASLQARAFRGEL